jgi:hypothetical protein
MPGDGEPMMLNPAARDALNHGVTWVRTARQRTAR